MCLMLDQFLWGHSSRDCDISCFQCNANFLMYGNIKVNPYMPVCESTFSNAKYKYVFSMQNAITFQTTKCNFFLYANANIFFLNAKCHDSQCKMPFFLFNAKCQIFFLNANPKYQFSSLLQNIFELVHETI